MCTAPSEVSDPTSTAKRPLNTIARGPWWRRRPVPGAWGDCHRPVTHDRALCVQSPLDTSPPPGVRCREGAAQCRRVLTLSPPHLTRRLVRTGLPGQHPEACLTGPLKSVPSEEDSGA